MTADQRRLAAILVADVVGYSRLVGADEAGTLAKLRALRSDIIEPAIEKHAGRLFKSVGDGFLVEFASAVQAVSAAQAIQQASVAGELKLRIGIHVGDVVVQGDDLMGDGVNIAARIEGVAEPGGIAISREVHAQVRDRLDVAFLDKGEVELKNIARPVQVFTIGSGGAALAAPMLALPDKPSIAVLPFQNMSGDPEQEYFADGMVEDIITALSRFKSLFVIARNSSFAYKGKAVDIKQVGRELGVRYVLEGSVRKAGGRVRITGQLIECATGSHLWADRFDGPLDGMFDLQDEVTFKVVASVAPRIDQVEIERSRRAPRTNVDAYDCMLRGMDHFYRSTRESVEEARLLFYRAMELDPGFATPYAMATRCYINRKIEAWTVDRDWEIAETKRLALQVQIIGRDDALALCWAGFALATVCGEDSAAVTMIDHALSINPNLAVAWRNRGALTQRLGHHEEAMEQVKKALRLSPIDPQTYIANVLFANSLICLGRYDEAAHWAMKALGNRADSKLARRALAIASALGGNLSEARKVVAELRLLEPWLSVSVFRDQVTSLRRPQDLERFAEGLRLAGLPE